MMKEGFSLVALMIIINAGLYVTGDFDNTNAFRFLPSELNQSEDVGSEGVLNPVTPIDFVSQNDDTGALGFAGWLFSSGLNAIQVFVFLLTGTIQIFLLLDPTMTWSFPILALVALINLFGVVFLVITFVSAFFGIFR